MAKYTKEFRVKAVLEYLSGETGGYTILSKNTIFLKLY